MTQCLVYITSKWKRIFQCGKGSPNCDLITFVLVLLLPGVSVLWVLHLFFECPAFYVSKHGQCKVRLKTVLSLFFWWPRKLRYHFLVVSPIKFCWLQQRKMISMFHSLSRKGICQRCLVPVILAPQYLYYLLYVVVGFMVGWFSPSPNHILELLTENLSSTGSLLGRILEPCWLLCRAPSGHWCWLNVFG